MKRTTDETTANEQRTADNKQPLICVPVCVAQAQELRAAFMRAAEVGDLIELRFDCLREPEINQALRELPELLNATARPIILTFRPAEQGGHRALSHTQRNNFWFLQLWPHEPNQPDFADIELDLVLQYAAQTKAGRHWWLDWQRVICSFHDFNGVPADLTSIYERMASTPAGVLKIAVQVNEITDCIAVLRLLERARSEGRKLIAVGMGAAGLLTRILAPARGGFLTYGALDPTQTTAPGQSTAAELRELYRVPMLDERTEVFGLMGRPVMHSLSPHMHNAAFAACGLNAIYIPFEVRDVNAFIKRMADPRTRELDWHLRGLSVTAPHKQTIMALLDAIEPAAREIGAVNTVVIEDDALHGYNTDALAALAPLTDLLKLNGARVAIIGAGGAARALLWGLQRADARVTVFARNVERAQTAAAKFGAACLALDDARFDAFDLVINATPLGTHGHTETETPATPAQLRGARVAYDLIYNPTETRFMRAARAAGCAHVIGGLSMLVAQAAAQFELWTGQRAPLAVMRERATRQLFARAD